jgi:L-asparaginase/Glu-tRNA(Gln) amidotransferase subunit D
MLLNFAAAGAQKSEPEVCRTIERPGRCRALFTHGNNAIEETAYFMNLTVRSEKPVVIVGVQQPF